MNLDDEISELQIEDLGEYFFQAEDVDVDSWKGFSLGYTEEDKQRKPLCSSLDTGDPNESPALVTPSVSASELAAALLLSPTLLPTTSVNSTLTTTTTTTRCSSNNNNSNSPKLSMPMSITSSDAARQQAAVQSLLTELSLAATSMGMVSGTMSSTMDTTLSTSSATIASTSNRSSSRNSPTDVVMTAATGFTKTKNGATSATNSLLPCENIGGRCEFGGCERKSESCILSTSGYDVTMKEEAPSPTQHQMPPFLVADSKKLQMPRSGLKRSFEMINTTNSFASSCSTTTPPPPSSTTANPEEDRGFRKKSREKMRRQEVNVKFDELIEILGLSNRVRKCAILQEAITAIKRMRKECDDLRRDRDRLRQETSKLATCLQYTHMGIGNTAAPTSLAATLASIGSTSSNTPASDGVGPNASASSSANAPQPNPAAASSTSIPAVFHPLLGLHPMQVSCAPGGACHTIGAGFANTAIPQAAGASSLSLVSSSFKPCNNGGGVCNGSCNASTSSSSADSTPNSAAFAVPRKAIKIAPSPMSETSDTDSPVVATAASNSTSL